MSESKCPKCEESITEMNAVSVNAKNGNKNLKGMFFTCPHCHTILGAGPDPMAIVDETIRRNRWLLSMFKQAQ